MVFSRRGFAQILAATAVAFPAAARAQAEPVIRAGIIPSIRSARRSTSSPAASSKRAGIAVELISLPNSAAIAAALSGGAINVGLANPIVIASAREARFTALRLCAERAV